MDLDLSSLAQAHTIHYITVTLSPQTWSLACFYKAIVYKASKREESENTLK